MAAAYPLGDGVVELFEVSGKKMVAIVNDHELVFAGEGRD
jgi:hypothetical protein